MVKKLINMHYQAEIPSTCKMNEYNKENVYSKHSTSVQKFHTDFSIPS